MQARRTTLFDELQSLILIGTHPGMQARRTPLFDELQSHILRPTSKGYRNGTLGKLSGTKSSGADVYDCAKALDDHLLGM